MDTEIRGRIYQAIVDDEDPFDLQDAEGNPGLSHRDVGRLADIAEATVEGMVEPFHAYLNSEHTRCAPSCIACEVLKTVGSVTE